MVEKQISLPDQSLRFSNAGKGDLSLRSNQKPGTLVQKTPVSTNKPITKAPVAAKGLTAPKAQNTTPAKTIASGAASTVIRKPPAKLSSRRPSVETLRSTISTVPTAPMTDGFSSLRSVAPSSSVSTVPSSKPRTVAAGKAPLKPWAIQAKSAQSTASKPAANGANKPKPLAQTASSAKQTPAKTAAPASKPVGKQDPPTVKMDQATFDRLRKHNTDGHAAKKPAAPLAPRNVNIDPAVLAKMKAGSKPILKSGDAKLTGSKTVQIDPAVLAKLKAGNK